MPNCGSSFIVLATEQQPSNWRLSQGYKNTVEESWIRNHMPLLLDNLEWRGTKSRTRHEIIAYDYEEDGNIKGVMATLGVCDEDNSMMRSVGI